MTTFKNRRKKNDYPIDCDLCGATCWFSESTVLSKETGKGGLRVCPDDRDTVDYGLVPYKVRPEKNVPDVRKHQEDITSGSTVPDFTTFNPMSGDKPS